MATPLHTVSNSNSMGGVRTAATVGFSIEAGDRERLQHLADVFGGGNRSEFLRKAMSLMERVEAAEQLGKLQAYGQSRANRRGLSPQDIPRLVEEALANPDPRAVAEAKLICAALRAEEAHAEPPLDATRELSDAEVWLRETVTTRPR